MNIWQLCESESHIQSISVEPWRIVEAQHVLSSRDLVDTAQEHDILEELLEASKPPIQMNSNYLISTPFRYPPLKYGSRFGQTFEPSLWYGSLDIDTAFAEVAYYRLLFMQSSSAELGYVELVLTAFQARLCTSFGLDLTESPFNTYRTELSHPTVYEDTQLLGTCMRNAHVEAFIYFSARSQKEAKNVAAFTQQVFHKKNNQYTFNQQTWNCTATKSVVEFSRIGVVGKQRVIITHPIDFYSY